MAERAPVPARDRGDVADTPARLFRARARDWAGLPALRWKEKGLWRGVTWAEYFAAARAVGLALMARGCRRGDAIAVLSENRVECAYVEFAALCIGALVDAIHPDATAYEIDRALVASGARVVFVESVEQRDKIRAAASGVAVVIFDATRLHGNDRATTIPFAEFLAQGAALADTDGAAFDRAIDQAGDDDGALIVRDDDNAVIVTLSNRAVMERAAALSRTVSLPPQSRNLAFFSISHLGARLATLHAQLTLGTNVHFPERPDTVLNDLTEVQPQFLYAPARFWEKLYARVELEKRGAIWPARMLYRWACRGRGPAAALVFPRLRWSLGLSRLRCGLSSGVLADDLVRWLGLLGVKTRIDDAASGPFAPIEARLRFHPLVADALVLARDGGSLTCVILLDRDTMLATAQAQQIAFADLDDLARAAPIQAMLRAEIDRVNEAHAPHRIVAFRLVADLTAGPAQMLTPSLRINRRLFIHHHASLIEEMNEEVRQ